MSGETKRLFVGNLPDDTSEQALQTEFASYGAVRSVEVKQQKSTDTGEIKSTFAFVTISIDDRMLDQCLREFAQEKYRGRFLKVTVARENFLDKLKREREEAAQLQAAKSAQNTISSAKSATESKAILPSFASKSTAKSSSESESSSDESISDDEEVVVAQKSTKINGNKKQATSSSSSDSNSDDDDGNGLVLRKKSKIFLENGKIKIDRNVSGGDAIHVIERSASKSNKKSLDEKSQKADQKRIESLKKMKNTYNEQKLAIKNALAGVDTSKRNNKIVFDDDDVGESSKSAQKPSTATKSKEKTPQKPALFDDNDEDDAESYKNDFKIKEQFQGAKGERLMRLQSRFQSDQRFNMDAKFLEDDADYGHQESRQKSHNGHEAQDDVEEDDERQWQYDILESVIGKKIRHSEPPKDPAKKKAPPSMLRFDPTRAEHTKFVEAAKKRPKKSDKDDSNAKRRRTDDDAEEHENAPPVSMDQFYEIRGDLKKSMGSGGFSLLSMFGRAGGDASTTTQNNSKYEETIIPKNNAKFLTDLDPFKYDSSGDEADHESNSKKKVKGIEATDDGKPTSNGSIWHESFFILGPNDERLNEGISFFVPADDGVEQPHEVDETKKQELRNIVKRKIKKSVKNALPRHVKPNKRFKRFTKNL